MVSASFGLTQLPVDESYRREMPTRLADADRLLALRPGPLVRAFEEVALAWRLSQQQRVDLLALASRSTWAGWTRDPEGARLDIVRRERIGHVIAIRLALLSLFGRGEAADGWPKARNEGALFAGHAPIDIMTSGTTAALAEVRDWLQGEVSR